MNPEMKDEVVQLYLDDIIPNRFQPREVFDEKALKELAISIKEHGVIQPIIVRSVNGKYEIIAGERRYKASALAGMTRIPAIIRDLDDKESSKVALLENLQRKNLNPIEEARTYQKILEIDQMTQEELAKTMGKSQSSVANKLRLLSLPDEVQDALLKEQVSERHARALLSVPDAKKQSELLKKIINTKMTVRTLEDEINQLYPKEIENKAVEQHSTIPPISSVINNTPLMPKTLMNEDTSDYGKVTLSPPVDSNMNISDNKDKYINYAEIDKDKLAQQNNINSRTDYYTATSFAPVDVKSIQEKAIDIKPTTNEPVAALDSLLNIQSTGPMNKPKIEEKEERPSISSMNSIPKREIQESFSGENKDYFGIPDFKNIDLPEVNVPVQTTDTIDALNSNTVLSVATPETQIDSSTAINKIKELIKELESKGIKVSMDEMDFGRSYQVIIKIDK